jgi:membrane-bound inhibitor of C-type lysozyme
MNHENQSEAIECDLLKVAENIHKEAGIKYSMDTKTLVVGQEVFAASGCYYSDGKVVKVTQEGVEVQLSDSATVNLPPR